MDETPSPPALSSSLRISTILSLAVQQLELYSRSTTMDESDGGEFDGFFFGFLAGAALIHSDGFLQSAYQYFEVDLFVLTAQVESE